MSRHHIFRWGSWKDWRVDEEADQLLQGGEDAQEGDGPLAGATFRRQRVVAFDGVVDADDDDDGGGEQRRRDDDSVLATNQLAEAWN